MNVEGRTRGALLKGRQDPTVNGPAYEDQARERGREGGADDGSDDAGAMAPTASAPRDALREKQGRAGIGGGGGGVRQRRDQTKASLAMATAAKAAAEAAHRALAQARGAGEQQAPRRQQGRFQGAADAPTVSYTSLRQSKSMAQLTAGLTAEEWEQQKDAVLVLKRAVQFLNDSVPQPQPELFVKRAAAGDVHTLREWFGRVDMRGARAVRWECGWGACVCCARVLL